MALQQDCPTVTVHVALLNESEHSQVSEGIY